MREGRQEAHDGNSKRRTLRPAPWMIVIIVQCSYRTVLGVIDSMDRKAAVDLNFWRHTEGHFAVSDDVLQAIRLAYHQAPIKDAIEQITEGFAFIPYLGLHVGPPTSRTN